jgi:hypothetical protein
MGQHHRLPYFEWQTILQVTDSNKKRGLLGAALWLGYCAVARKAQSDRATQSL